MRVTPVTQTVIASVEQKERIPAVLAEPLLRVPRRYGPSFEAMASEAGSAVATEGFCGEQASAILGVPNRAHLGVYLRRPKDQAQHKYRLHFVPLVLSGPADRRPVFLEAIVTSGSGTFKVARMMGT
jgi:hypothetical protein